MHGSFPVISPLFLPPFRLPTRSRSSFFRRTSRPLELNRFDCDRKVCECFVIIFPFSLSVPSPLVFSSHSQSLIVLFASGFCFSGFIAPLFVISLCCFHTPFRSPPCFPFFPPFLICLEKSCRLHCLIVFCASLVMSVSSVLFCSVMRICFFLPFSLFIFWFSLAHTYCLLLCVTLIFCLCMGWVMNFRCVCSDVSCADE